MPNIADILTAYGKVADFVRGRKTYIVSGLLVVVGLVRLIAGEIDITAFLASQDLVIVLNGLGLGFLRAGVNAPSEQKTIDPVA